MGYVCPVCGHPQSDAEHLANHLAFTALARGGDHERWLDEHAPDWGSLDESALGERVTDRAERTEFPQVFEDTTRGDGGERDPLLDNARVRAGDGEFSDDAEAVLREARELTRERRESASEQESPETDPSTDGGSDSETE